jgi:Ser/Thr protein kinase RdoA (MazF antagonist)
MKKEIRESMSQDVLSRACDYYNFTVKDLTNLNGFENFVYGFNEFVIRFVHSIHRTYDQVLAEIEFIDFLSENNASVSTIVRSNNNNISEKISLNVTDYFTVTLFTRAPGTFVKKEEMNEELFVIIGQEIGRLHRLTKSYKPLHARHDWEEENYIDLYQKYVPEEQKSIITKCKAIQQKIKKIPMQNSNYGLIHTDLHFGNMYKEEKKLTFFDFDDSSYHYFVSDIAIVLYYYFVFTDTESNRQEKGRQILSALLKGYKQYNLISKDMLMRLNDFLKLRESILYLVLVGDKHIQEINPEMQLFIEQLQTNLEDDIPFFEDLDALIS